MENIHRCRMLFDMPASSLGGVMAIAGVHRGSPIMEEILILLTYDFNSKKELVKYLAGIEE